MTKQKQFEEKVVSFLYELGRDHLPLGDIELIVRHSEIDPDVNYCNKGLEKYAREIVNRLNTEHKELTTNDIHPYDDGNSFICMSCGTVTPRSRSNPFPTIKHHSDCKHVKPKKRKKK